MLTPARGRPRRSPSTPRSAPRRNRSAWHVPEDTAAAYADGTLADTAAWSVDKHLESCAACSARISALVRTGTGGAVLSEVRDAVLTAAAGTAPRVAEPRTAEARPRTAVARPWLAAVRSARTLRPAWVGSVLLTLAVAVALTRFGGAPQGRPWLLVLAPALPPVGVALAYGRYGDPAHELAASTPSGGLRLLLTRTGAVLAVCVPLLTAAGGVLAGTGAAVAWLLPGLVLTGATLALGSWTGCHRAAAVVTGCWLGAVVLCGLPPHSAPLLLSPAAQPAWAAAAAACALLLTLRRTAFDHMERL
ncbi:zf-HC2 domain-containing protein [Actinacidiphila glaucinigra]|uniref:zf-HC2 domain-containing protein n=1 Tax=Actinacidiphila glaucinigra TaxID=235986 RepID=UPI0029A0ACD9|nr:zf-HC2 domain-containing protein [Streptomyces sp. PA03-3a]